MSERKITILEYHSHGDGPRLFSDIFERGSKESEQPASEESEGGRRLRPLFALVLLVGIAAAYRYFRSRDDSTTYDEEQVEVAEYED